MKAKKMMRWMLALTLTGVCAALAVMTLDTWTGRQGADRPAAAALVVTTATPVVIPEADAPGPGSPASGAVTGPAATASGSGDAAPGPPVASRPAGDEAQMLPAAPPVPDGPGRLLEQIETARAGLLAAQSNVPAHPAGRAAWLPVLFLAGGGGLIGCALGLGLGSLFLRKRGSTRAAVNAQPAGAPARMPSTPAVDSENPAESVLRVARAELASRATWDRAGSPAVSATPGADARRQALSRLAAATELAATAPPCTAMPAPLSGTRSTGEEPSPAGSPRRSFFKASPGRRKTADQPAPAETASSVSSADAPRTTRLPGVDPEIRLPGRSDEADPVDRRIAALERSLLQVVRAMEEVADRVTNRETTSTRASVRASTGRRDTVENGSAPEPAEHPILPWYAEDDGDLDGAALAPPMRAPRRRERQDRGSVVPPRAVVAPAAAPQASPPAAGSERSAPSVARAVRALRAARDLAPAAPEPWDLAPAAKASGASVAPARRAPAPSTPSASTADGRDLVRIRRAVLRLSAEGWDGPRIAGRLRLGEGDVALILKTAGVEQRLQTAGRA